MEPASVFHLQRDHAILGRTPVAEGVCCGGHREQIRRRFFCRRRTHADHSEEICEVQNESSDAPPLLPEGHDLCCQIQVLHQVEIEVTGVRLPDALAGHLVDLEPSFGDAHGHLLFGRGHTKLRRPKTINDHQMPPFVETFGCTRHKVVPFLRSVQMTQGLYGKYEIKGLTFESVQSARITHCKLGIFIALGKRALFGDFNVPVKHVDALENDVRTQHS